MDNTNALATNVGGDQHINHAKPADHTSGKLGTSRRMVAATMSAALVSACGGGGGSSPLSPTAGGGAAPSPSPSPTPTPTPTSSAGTSEWAERAFAARFLLRAQFSASMPEIEAVRREGLEAWLTRQMKIPNDQTGAQFMAEKKFDVVDEKRSYFSRNLVDPMIWSQLLSGGNAVRKRAVFALSQFFVVSVNNLDFLWRSNAVAYFWDLLNEHAFGNFRDLLEAVTLSPAMGAFLDTIGNLPDDPATNRKPDENFAREVMQLFTIGLQELHIDGTPKMYAGIPIETYTNDDVAGLARVFTGYNLDASNLQFFPEIDRPTRLIPHVDIVRRPMTANNLHWERPRPQSAHSLLEKRFLGMTIPAGTDAPTSLRLALDRLFNHPNVGPFFGKQMIQRLVTSNPSPEYVTRVAQAFNDNGRGIRGDLAAVFKAILLDPEANHPNGLNDMRFGKLREPVVRFVQIARSSGMTKSDGRWITSDLSDPARFLGQAPLRAPSVFNFFRPQYVLPNSVTVANAMVGPEFQIVSEISIPVWLNFVQDILIGKASWLNGMKPEFTAEMALADRPQELLDHLDLILTAGQLRPATRASVLSGIESVAVTAGDEAARLRRVQIAYALITCSNDYLVQK